MSSVNIFWDPAGISLDTLLGNKFIRTKDGDTPVVSMSIRMLSIDTPETTDSASNQNKSLKQLATWIKEKKAPIKNELADHLLPKLDSGQAGTLQKNQGKQATVYFKELLEKKLTKPNGDKRDLFLRAADEHFDQYGRLLSYLAPKYSYEELESMSLKDRATFNLLMVDSGWAASFPIYPSIPKYSDLRLLREAAKDAIENKRGAWANQLSLTGYEYRMCKRLYSTTKKMVVDGDPMYGSRRYDWISRYCVDMMDRRIYYPQDYYMVEPFNRIFIWPKDVVEAVAKMNLIPAY